jgi:hypothetical protein
LIETAAGACEARLAFVAFISAIDRLIRALFTVGRKAAVDIFPAMNRFSALPATNDQDHEAGGTKQDPECLHLTAPRALMLSRTTNDDLLVEALALIEAVRSTDLARPGVGGAAVGTFVARVRLVALLHAIIIP